MPKQSTVVVYQIGSLGDTIVSIPCYRAIRRHFRGSKILLLEAQLKIGRIMPSDMLIREGLIDGVASYPHRESGTGFQGKLDVFKTVRKCKAQSVVYIGPAERPPKVVERDKLFFRLCGAKNLIGFHGVDYEEFSHRNTAGHLPMMPHQSTMRLNRLAKDNVDIHESDTATPLLNPTIQEKERALDWLATNREFPDRKLVTIGVKTAKPLTQWPMENFEVLGRELYETGKVEIVITGGPGDISIAEKLIRFWGGGIVAAGQFGIHEMAALISWSDLYIGLDTGTTHLAAAVCAPILGIYADHTQPGEWDPMGNTAKLLVSREPCGGCRGFQCKTAGHPCMTNLSVDVVLNQALQMLE